MAIWNQEYKEFCKLFIVFYTDKANGRLTSSLKESLSWHDNDIYLVASDIKKNLSTGAQDIHQSGQRLLHTYLYQATSQEGL